MLLERFGIPFICESPDIDESARENESPTDLVRRLAVEKARKVAASHPRSLVIGSDQLATVDDDILGKPGDIDTAIKQLQRLRGQCVQFQTGLCVTNLESELELLKCIIVEVKFRHYSDNEIKRYLEKEDALNCAGAFRSEGLGISLVDEIITTDPTALIGLPLICLRNMLAQAGLAIP
jgi:septum formation protein